MNFLVYLVAMILFSSIHSYAGDILNLGKPADPIADISSRVLTKAYQRIGLKINFIELPAERSLLKSNEGSLDGEVNRIIGMEKIYTNLILIPIPINSFVGVAFSKNHNFSVDGWDSLRPYSIAIRIGSKFAEYGTRDMNVTTFPTYDKVFELVSQDRYDICIASVVTGLFYIKKNGLKGIKVLDPPLTNFKLYHYLHKKNKNWVAGISRSLQQMQQEGEISREREVVINELFESNMQIE